MNSKTVVWIAIGVIIVVVAIFAFRPASGGGVENIDATKAAEVSTQSGVQIIDVRTAGEYQMGHIKGAQNVPVDTLAQQAQNWDREATYLVYCATGQRSATAVETMKAMGFTDIKHFNTGMQSWGGPVETGAPSAGSKVETSGKPVMIEFYTDS